VQSFLAAVLPRIRDDTDWESGWSPTFTRQVAERGWLGLAWPREYGGGGRPLIEQAIMLEEMAYARAPQEHHRRSVQQVGPTVMLYGTPNQKARYLPNIVRGDCHFVTGLSEPDAGSDLANAQTRAVRDGDDYVITGQKRYTSGAHHGDHIWLLARTDPDAPKHRGLSVIVVDMATPGVTVRPLIDMAGLHHFNEVFFDQARVPAANLVGEENRGWYVNATTMDFERSGMARIGRMRRELDDLPRLVRRDRDRLRRDRSYRARRAQIADLVVLVETARVLAMRVAWMQDRGLVPSHETSIVKFLASEAEQAIPRTMAAVLGLHGALTPGSAWTRDGGHAAAQVMASVPATIAQGSSEVQKDVIARRGLGLPR
jgi:3-oxocholest-4-en-26-oyl-CoA dehydrogenase alpha subunit